MKGLPGDHVRHNRTFWDADADDYQAAHGDALARAPIAWGVFRVPESELCVLGDVAGHDVLELGCGAAQWSAALTRGGAGCVGVDVSSAQLKHARRASPRLPLVLADGEELPFRDGSFDVVFCDHGAMSFCDPSASLPEVARVLRRGGLLAFCATHPLLYLTYDESREKQTRTLQRDYDTLGRMELGDGTIDWALPAGEWIGAFRAHGFDVERLVELRAPKGATTTYTDFVRPRWARRWPAEQVWCVRRR